MSSKIGIVILVHGTRDKRGASEVEQTFTRLSSELKLLIPGDSEIIGAALQFNHPDLGEAIQVLINKRAHTIIIVPYFLFSGRHITEDIPQIVSRFSMAHPATKFIIAETLGHNTSFTGLIISRIRNTAPELWGNGNNPASTVSDIELHSMQIIEGLLPANLSVTAAEREVIKRIVHASGDPAIVESIRFSNGAIELGINALKKASPIYTDVRMVYAGINKQMANKYSIPVHCILDSMETADDGVTQGNTRTSAAIKSLGENLNGSIVVIGNAPTALMALIELMDSGKVTPSLVVGMPVGFVQAKESKDELMQRKIPYITITGTRGGTAMAVATVNALLRQL